jgi:hypothetical protein
MGTYFIFSDECGEYCEEKTLKKLKAHPYYIRSALIISSDEWKFINNKMKYLKRKLFGPIINNYEIKWSYLWNKRCYERRGEAIPENKPYYFLNGIKYNDLIKYVDKILGYLSDLEYCKIILTITPNLESSRNLYEIYRWHIESIMQRIEMELELDSKNLGVLFIDPLSTDKNKLLRNIYYDLYKDNFFIEHKCIKDSLNIEYSHHSVCIQIADYIAGSFDGFMKGFAKSTEIFASRIKPLLRRGKNQEILGYGIREVPSNKKVREKINKKLLILTE